MVLFCYDPKQNRQGATENLGDLGLNQPKLVDLNHICGDNIDMFIAIFSSAEVFSYNDNDHSCFLDFMVDPSWPLDMFDHNWGVKLEAWI